MHNKLLRRWLPSAKGRRCCLLVFCVRKAVVQCETACRMTDATNSLSALTTPLCWWNIQKRSS